MPAPVVVVGGAERHEDGGDDVVDEVEEGGEEQAQVLAQPRETLLRIQTASNPSCYVINKETQIR